MHTVRQKNGLSGSTSRSESEYDPFGAGHGCNSISAGLGSISFPSVSYSVLSSSKTDYEFAYSLCFIYLAYLVVKLKFR